MILAWFYVLLTVLSVTNGQHQSGGQEKDVGDKCSTSEYKGECKIVKECSAILENLRKKIFNHTVCGYQNLDQIVCCPIKRHEVVNRLPQRIINFNFSEAVDCIVENTGAKGVIKIRDDCPEVFGTTSIVLCPHQICQDLVCCPITNTKRHKQICAKVDDPREEIELRLRSNQPCTVPGLNISGIYQTMCEYSDRNPHLQTKLQEICDDNVCDHWYCCPIVEPKDKFYCDRKLQSYNHIDFIGPKCVDSKSGKSGTCRLLGNCPIQHLNELDVCGVNCCDNYYCCPDVDVSNEPLVIQKCWEYTKTKIQKEVRVELHPANATTEDRTECTVQREISGGFSVVQGQHPHMAALGYQFGDEPIEWNCGGSLISERYVLTAGHCLQTSNGTDVQFIRMGVIHLRQNITLGSYDCAEDYLVAQIIPHPEYDRRSVYNDIGLIRLDRDVKFNFHIRPVCLPATPDIPNEFLSMGWGALGPSDQSSVSLIQVYQELFSYEECAEHYKYFVNRRFTKGVLNETQICAGSKTGIQSTCGGDSGGPLLFFNKHFELENVYEIYGVVSFGTICGFANSPGIYTKVFPYVKWIEQIVWP